MSLAVSPCECVEMGICMYSFHCSLQSTVCCKLISKSPFPACVTSRAVYTWDSVPLFNLKGILICLFACLPERSVVPFSISKAPSELNSLWARPFTTRFYLVANREVLRGDVTE